MAALSIVLGVLSLACIALGVLTTPVPVIGALFSFAAPALAIAGIIVGGVAMSRSKRAALDHAAAEPGSSVDPDSEPRVEALTVPRVQRPPGSNGAALTGVIVSSIAVLPALLTAMTCGVCNALCSTGQIQTQRDFRFDVQRGTPVPVADAGLPAEPHTIAPTAEPDAAAAPDHETPPPAFPPPAFPPPPLQAPR